jgi:hypothetical protein
LDNTIKSNNKEKTCKEEQSNDIIGLEDLLEIAGQSKSSGKIDESDVLGWIIRHDIKKGDVRIQSDLVYQHYNKTVLNPIGYKAFMRRFSKYFEKGRTNSCVYYLLNPKSFNIPDDYSIYKQKYVKQTHYNDEKEDK